LRFALDIRKNTTQRLWKKPKVVSFLKSKIRRDVSTYPNYLRIIWLKLDLTLQWGE